MYIIARPRDFTCSPSLWKNTGIPLLNWPALSLSIQNLHSSVDSWIWRKPSITVADALRCSSQVSWKMNSNFLLWFFSLPSLVILVASKGSPGCPVTTSRPSYIPSAAGWASHSCSRLGTVMCWRLKRIFRLFPINA
ncbi:hypothetical protein D3C71_1810470 [compost metagenome]